MIDGGFAVVIILVGCVGWGMGFLCSGGMKVDFLAKR